MSVDEYLEEAQDKYSYSKLDDKQPLDGTMFRKLSVGGLRFDKWIDKSLNRENTVLLATYPHKIVLFKYIIGLLIGLVTALLVTQFNMLLSVMIGVIAVVYLLNGVMKYYSTYYVLADDKLISKQSWILNDSAKVIPLDQITHTESDHSTTGKLVSLMFRDFENIRVYTAGTGSEKSDSGGNTPELQLTAVPEPEIFREELGVLLDD